MNRFLESMKKELRDFWNEESGMGTIEIVIIVFILIGLGFLFKSSIEHFFSALISKLDANAIGNDLQYKK